MTEKKAQRRRSPETLETNDLERANGGTISHEPLTMEIGGAVERKQRFLDHDFGLNE